jgi:endoglucanase
MDRKMQDGSRRTGRHCFMGAVAFGAVIGMGMLACASLTPPKAEAQMTMLHASGTNIVDANGGVVPLRGVNLGGWFIMEKWMCPLDSGSLPDTYSVIQTLDNRFGVATEQSLIAGYQQNWITTTDLDNIRNAGFNVVRVPVWWGQFYPLNNVSNAGWRSDAFTELDWLVNAASSRGIYVIIDMHGVVGSQSTSGDTGQQNLNQYWSNSNDQGNTAFMWWQIASHYKGNATVAGYDLINEPTGAPNNQAVWTAYNNLYNSVRSADPGHMIFMEGAFNQWNWSMLPPPSQYGWTNVVYQMHEYQFNGSQAQVEAGSTNQVNDFKNHSSWNVPGYIGEFNDFGYGSSAWQFSLNAYNNGGLSWTMWAHKATHGLNPDSWGFYDPTFWPATPNISSDSAATIQSDWKQWTTTNAFALNTSLGISGGVNGGGGGNGISTSSWYNIVNQNSSQCADAAGWGTANGTALQQYTCGSQQHNQEWQFTPTSNGYYTVTNRNAPLVWDVTGGQGATGTGVKIQLWSSGSGTNQQWMPVPLGNGYYKFVVRNSGLCLDTPGASTTPGTQLQQWTCNGSTAQAFQLSEQP